jgi:hypothetical protein
MSQNGNRVEVPNTHDYTEFIDRWSQNGRTTESVSLHRTVNHKSVIITTLILIDDDDVIVSNGVGKDLIQANKRAIKALLRNPEPSQDRFSYYNKLMEQQDDAINNDYDLDYKLPSEWMKLSESEKVHVLDRELEAYFERVDGSDILFSYYNRLMETYDTFETDYDLDFLLPPEWLKLTETEKLLQLDAELDAYFRQ